MRQLNGFLFHGSSSPDQLRQAANAFVALGVEEQENIGIFSQNKLANGSMSTLARLPIGLLLFRFMQRVHLRRRNISLMMRRFVSFL